MSRNKRIRHEGAHSFRLRQDNPREVAFAERWKKEQSGGSVLAYLLIRTEGGDPLNPFSGKTVQLAPYDQQSATVAATVIQWLGSNVGFSFLEEALSDCGFKIVRK